MAIYQGKPIVKGLYFHHVFFLKTFYSLILGIIYYHYYGGGDTINYFESAVKIKNLFTSDLISVKDIILKSNTLTDTWGIRFASDWSTYSVVILSLILSIIVGPNYFLQAITLSLFLSVLYRKLFLKLRRSFDHKFIYWLVLSPMLGLWTSSLMKETLIMIPLLYILLNLIQKPSLLVVVRLGLALLFIGIIKPYISLVLCLVLAINWIYEFIGLFVEKKLRIFFSLIAMVVVYQLSIDVIVGGMASLQNTYDYIHNQSIKQGGANYYVDWSSLGGLNIIWSTPFYFVRGLFEPFIWNAKNMLMVISFVDSLIVLLYLFRLFKSKGKYYFEVRSLFIFAALFIVIVWITTGNYGSLVRYRLPGVLFLIGAFSYRRYYILGSD